MSPSAASSPQPGDPGEAPPVSEPNRPGSLAAVPPAAQADVQRAQAALAQELNIDVAEIEVGQVTPRFKPSAATGGSGDARGWQIQLLVGGKRYIYLTDEFGAPSLRR